MASIQIHLNEIDDREHEIIPAVFVTSEDKESDCLLMTGTADKCITVKYKNLNNQLQQQTQFKQNQHRSAVKSSSHLKRKQSCAAKVHLYQSVSAVQMRGRRGRFAELGDAWERLRDRCRKRLTIASCSGVKLCSNKRWWFSSENDPSFSALGRYSFCPCSMAQADVDECLPSNYRGLKSMYALVEVRTSFGASFLPRNASESL